MTTAFTCSLRGIPGRPETGRWLQLTPGKRIDGTFVATDFYDRGGWFNPPGRFSMLYFAADTEECKARMLRWMSADGGTLVLQVQVRLRRILDLGNASVRRAARVTLRELFRPDDPSLSRSLGIAALREGFDGIVYPRPLAPRQRNLGIFLDRVNPQDVTVLSLAEAS